MGLMRKIGFHKWNARQGEVVLLLLVTVLTFAGGLANSAGAAAPADGDLSNAVRKNDLSRVKTLVKQGANVNAINGGATPAGWAIAYDASPELLEYLLDHGATVPITDNRQQWSQPSAMLFGAVSLGRKAQAAVLIARGADVNVSNNAGTTPLHLAAMGGHVDTMRLLIDKGAKTDTLTANGMSPLVAALISRQFPAAGWLARSCGMLLHRCESDVCLSSAGLQSQTGMASIGGLRMNVNGPAIPVPLSNREGTGNMQPAGFSGVLDAGRLLTQGKFEYDGQGNACLKKGGFIVLPEDRKADTLAETVDLSFHSLLTKARVGDLDARIRLVDHFAAVGNMETSNRMGNDGTVRVAWMGALPPDGTMNAISKNGLHFAYVSPRNNWQAVVVDGVIGPEFDKILPDTIYLSPDGKHVAYGAVRNGETFAVFDGRRGPAFDGVRELVISPDGGRFAYKAARGTKRMVVVDSENGPEYDGLGDIVFSQDGKRVAYSAKLGDRMFMVVDGKPGAQHEGIGGPNLSAFSHDAKRFLYVGIDGGKFSVIVDGHAGQGCEGFMSAPIFSPDGKHVAYAALKGGLRYLVMDNDWKSEYEGYAYPTFSPVGNRFAYVAAQGGKALVVVDGKPESKHSLVNDLIFSPNGRHVAYFATDGNEFTVIVDGKPGRKHRTGAIGTLRFTPDGRGVAYVAVTGTQYHIVLDGQDGPRFDGLSPGGPTYRPDGALEYIAMREGILYRVQHVRPPKVAPGEMNGEEMN
jgi:roadblock/LC7 domain-containing protein